MASKWYMEIMSCMLARGMDETFGFTHVNSPANNKHEYLTMLRF
jgi:hypothetical protein